MNGCFRSAVGIFIAVPSLLMGLIAAGLIFAEDSAFRGIGVFFGGLAFVGLVIAVRRFRRPNPSSTDVADVQPKTSQYRWGKPPPTHKQIAYAKDLGVKFVDGMTKLSISDAIDDALADRKPATAEQLREIRQMHGVLPREITQLEAEDVIRVLTETVIQCPHCACKCQAFEAKCSECNKSLAKVKLPIRLKKR